MQLKTAQSIPLAIAVAVVSLTCVLHTARLPVLERLEWMTYDMRARKALLFPGPISTNLGFASIDELSISMVRTNLFAPIGYGLYWPRHVYGRIVDELAAQGAKCVAFDVLFGELRFDHASVLSHDTTKQVESDEYFAEACAAASNVVLAVNQSLMPPALFRSSAAILGDVSTDKDSDGILRRARAFRHYTKWHPAFEQLEADPFMGVDLSKACVEPRRVLLPRSPDPVTGEKFEPIEIPLDQNGCFDILDFTTNPPPAMARFSKPFIQELFWHMGVILAAYELGLDLAQARIDLAHGKIDFPDRQGRIVRTLPVDSEGAFYVDWSLPPNHPSLLQQPVHELLKQNAYRLQGETNGLGSPWKGKLVLIGSSALANDLTDRGATPLFKDNLLVSKHWNVANSIITNRFVRRLPPYLELVVIVLLGGMTAWLTWTVRSSWLAVGVGFALAGAYVLSGLFVYVQDRLWLPYVLPVLAASFTQVGMLTWRVVFEQAGQRRVRSMFSKMVSPKIVNEVLRMETLSLGGARHEITVFFADVRGFTELTVRSQQQTMDFIRAKGLTGAAAEACHERHARETLDTVNTYLDVIAQVVTSNDGTLDKFIGDCVMAFWGAPTVNARHATACVRAAIQAQIAVHRLNQARAAENARRKQLSAASENAGHEPLPELPILALGTGINTGMATAGLMGSARADSLSYTVFGREVNLASRLEGASGHGRIFISANTLAHLKRDDPELAALCIPQAPVRLKGFAEPVEVYEVPWKTIDAMGTSITRLVPGKKLAPVEK